MRAFAKVFTSQKYNWFLKIGLIVLVTILIKVGISGAIFGSRSTDLQVDVFKPLGKAERKTNITVIFSQDAVETDSLDKTLPVSPLVIDPPTAGVARWIGPNTLRFFPDHELLPATKYNVRLQSSKTFIKGRKIKEDRVFTFLTPALRVENIRYQRSISPQVRGFARLIVELTFNYAVDISQLKSKLKLKGQDNAEEKRPNFTLAPTGAGAIGSKSWRDYTNKVTLTTEPIRITEKRQSYRVTINKGLTCDSCSFSMESDYSGFAYIDTKRKLTVNQLRSGIEAGAGVIYLEMSTPVESEDAARFITVSPKVEFKVVRRRSMLVLSGGFKSGETYEVTLSAGLMLLDGSELEREFSSKVTIPDLPPTLAFVSRGIYMPSGGSKLLELQTTNIDEITIEVEKIFPNNLVHALAGGYTTISRYGQRNIGLVGASYMSMDAALDNQKNISLTSAVDVGSMIGSDTRGVFRIVSHSKNSRWVSDTRLVMLTDIGISARMSDDYLMVWAYSLQTVKKLSGVTVTLWSRNNQKLLQGVTDKSGALVFNKLADTLSGFEPYVVTAEMGSDLAYMRFSDCRLATSDFDVAGRPYLTSGYEAFVYLDRGVYRPGEKAHIVTMIRDAKVNAPKQFPVSIRILDPTGREFKILRVTPSANGVAEVTLEIPTFARTGKYSIQALIGKDYQIGAESFQVEEFVPDRIKTTLKTDKQDYLPSEAIQATVRGQFLFGPPTVGHRVGGRVTIERVKFAPKSWPGYSFENVNNKFTRQDKELPSATLNDSGLHVYRYVLPDTLRAPSMLKALLAADVYEQGGRTVSAYREVNIHPYRRYLGMKLNLDGYASPNETVTTQIIGVSPTGKALAVDSVVAKFYRLVYNSSYKRDRRGRYRYISEVEEKLVDTKTIALPKEGATVQFTPVQYGEYRIITSDYVSGHSCSVDFYASGWGYAPWSMSKPDRIDIELDKKSYSPGDTAVAQIRGPFGGALLVTLERDTVLQLINLSMPENTAEFRIPVRAEYLPNIYLTASIIKAAPDVDGDSPARAFGVAALRVDYAKQRLPLTVSVPKNMKPRNALKVNIDIGQPGLTELTVAAVDAGILQLTDYSTPNPLEFFYGKRRLQLKSYDMYSFIYPEVKQAANLLSPSGGRMFAQARRRHVNPVTAKRFTPVALWSGVVTTDSSGKAIVTLNVPQFNGKLAVAVVAAQQERLGFASEEVTVRDNITVQESFPRFISPNDSVSALVTVFNNSPDTAEIAVRLFVDGPALILSDSVVHLRLAPTSEGAVRFALGAKLAPGIIKTRIVATSGSERSEITFELPNRPAQPLRTEYGSGALKAGDSAVVTLPSGMVEGTQRLVARVSSLAGAQFSRNIDYLLRYPYGCLEQTTSRLFPLLYFSDLAKFTKPELIGSRGHEYFIQEGITRLLGMLRSDGTFSYWPGGTRTHIWSSIYASHFILEAHAAGYYVSRDVRKTLIKRLKEQARRSNNDAEKTAQRVYSAYALAKTGNIDRKIVNELKNIDTENLPSYSKYQLAAIFAVGDDIGSARVLLPTQIQPALFEPETGGNFNSGVRTDAILLEALLTIDREDPACAVLAKSLIDRARIGGWRTTQENAFALMALGKYLSGEVTPKFSGKLTVVASSVTGVGAKDTTVTFDESGVELAVDSVDAKELLLATSGVGNCFYYWQVSGVSASNATEEFNRGITLSRKYLTSSGEPLDVGGVVIGDQIVCEITIEAQNKSLYNVVINDLLPAGLEIENPRLETSASLPWLPRGKTPVERQDIRDDRALFFTDLRSNKPVVIYYSLRATTAGEFKIPPVSAECMYNPLIAASTSNGVMRIAENATH